MEMSKKSLDVEMEWGKTCAGKPISLENGRNFHIKMGKSLLKKKEIQEASYTWNTKLNTFIS